MKKNLIAISALLFLLLIAVHAFAETDNLSTLKYATGLSRNSNIPVIFAP